MLVQLLVKIVEMKCLRDAEECKTMTDYREESSDCEASRRGILSRGLGLLSNPLPSYVSS